MINTKLSYFITIAEQHDKRMHQASKEIGESVTASDFDDPDIERIKSFELFTSRFAKLQDVLGAKLFPLYLHHTGEEASNLTFIDKLNKLERLGIIESADMWMDMRHIRNIITHEYPDDLETLALSFNQALSMSCTLSETLKRIKDKVTD